MRAKNVGFSGNGAKCARREFFLRRAKRLIQLSGRSNFLIFWNFPRNIQTIKNRLRPLIENYELFVNETAPHQSTSLTASPRGKALRQGITLFALFSPREKAKRGSLWNRLTIFVGFCRGKNKARGSHKSAEYFCRILRQAEWIKGKLAQNLFT